MNRPLASLLVCLAPAAGVSACARELPPHGEALFYVDTDLAVPALAGRLRVDLYAEDGTWFESRDIGRADPRDWPASFGVYSDLDSADKRVLVRLRAYPESVVRDYVGEHFAPRPTFHEPPVAATLADLCAGAPTLKMGERITLRRGGVPLTEIAPAGRCAPPTRVGSVAARVVIDAPGTYRFDVASMSPYGSESTLFLRGDCNDAASQLACDAEQNVSPLSSGHFPRFDVELRAGTYYVLSGGTLGEAPADVTLEVLPVDTPLPDDDPGSPPAPRPATPRLVRGADPTAPDLTPKTEPEPAAAVDRLVLVDLRPGERRAARVTLRGACAGTMAKLGAADGTVDLSAAATCVDAENLRVPLAEADGDADLSAPLASAQGTFGVEASCSGAAAPAGAVCVPGGVFLLGSNDVPVLGGPFATTPRRIVRMPRFYMDRNEVTVAELRAAAAAGLAIDASAVGINDKPLGVQGPQTDPFEDLCTYSSAPMGREDYPANCVTWRLARAYCRVKGGDLPSEAEWEYAATVAGKAKKSAYPWGDDAAGCDRAVFGRSQGGDAPGGIGVCTRSGAPALPQPVTTADGHDGRPGDVTPLGIVNLGGSVAEWTRDAWAGFAEDCWASAPMTSPFCWEENAPLRAVRGASWLDDGVAAATFRTGAPAGLTPSNLVYAGLRCTYAEPPR
jgi:formylglycine-generating enzyme required for sulfatase activity